MSEAPAAPPAGAPPAGAPPAGAPPAGAPPAGAPPAADWLATLSPDARAVATAKGWTTPDDVITKGYAPLERTLGADKVALWRKDATPEEIQKWDGWSKLGRPEDPGKYEFKLPKDYQATDQDKAFHAAIRPAIHKAGLNQQQLDVVGEAFNSFSAQAHQAQQKAIADQLAAGETALRGAWGDQFDTNMEIANAAVRKFGGDELVKELEQGAGRFPNLVKAFHALGQATQGDDERPGGSGGGGGMASTPEQAKVEIARINAEAANDSKHPYSNRSHPEHKAMADRMLQLYTLAYPGNAEPS